MAKQELLGILNLFKVVLRKIYIKFCDEQARSKAMRSSYLGRKNFRVPMKNYETEILIKKGSASQSIKRIQFPVTLGWASTYHSFQGLSLEQCVIDFDR